mmetsp:Transcript_106834/g.184294  ORF Transcript_106834/g.184294 Transcript_106834/m.184294 type:complete len:147 (+) Transcript_106834:498-938(+)
MPWNPVCSGSPAEQQTQLTDRTEVVSQCFVVCLLVLQVSRNLRRFLIFLTLTPWTANPAPALASGVTSTVPFSCGRCRLVSRLEFPNRGMGALALPHGQSTHPALMARWQTPQATATRWAWAPASLTVPVLSGVPVATGNFLCPVC